MGFNGISLKQKHDAFFVRKVRVFDGENRGGAVWIDDDVLSVLPIPRSGDEREGASSEDGAVLFLIFLGVIVALALWAWFQS